MADLNLEIQRGTEHGRYRVTHPIDRPDGMDDEAYATHAQNAAELVAKVLTDRPGGLMCMAGVVMMVVEEGSVPESEIAAQLSDAAIEYDCDQTWREAHVIQLRTPEPTL